MLRNSRVIVYTLLFPRTKPNCTQSSCFSCLRFKPLPRIRVHLGPFLVTAYMADLNRMMSYPLGNRIHVPPDLLRVITRCIEYHRSSHVEAPNCPLRLNALYTATTCMASGTDIYHSIINQASWVIEWPVPVDADSLTAEPTPAVAAKSLPEL